MKRRTIGLVAAAALAGALAVAAIGTAFAQTQPGYGPGGMMGGQGYTPGGMMGGAGFGTVGMMGRGAATAQAQPLNSLDDARAAFQRYIDATGNANFALDEVIHFQANYYAIVKDSSTGEGAFELLANPQTGAVFPEMGPNLMWNTQYGHMAGFGMMGGGWQQPTGQPTVSADKAQQLAQAWLDANQPGGATETPDSFPGYYTLHITRGDTMAGMLSVNAYSGAVWYHSWHGAFISLTEA